MKTTVQFHCDQGDHDVTAEVAAYGNGNPMFTGYGCYIDAKGVERKACHACCADLDRADMIATGKATLYLTWEQEARPRAQAGQYIHRKHAKVSNWGGSLSFPVASLIRVGAHNIARVRYDFRFTGPDGATWAGTQYGDNTQIAHCRRVRA